MKTKSTQIIKSLDPSINLRMTIKFPYLFCHPDFGGLPDGQCR